MAELTAISVLVTTCAAAVVGIIAQIQHSRCTELNILCGLCKCTRSVPDVEEPQVELSRELATQ